MDAHRFFDALWTDFTALAPQAAAIKAAFEAVGEVVLNDHVAFRTYDRGPLTLAHLEPHLLAMGFAPFEDYGFEAKKLRARSYLHPDPTVPRVFLSELQVSRCSPALQAVVDALVAQVPVDRAATPDVLWAGRPWAPVSFATWEALGAESEYAAWVAAHGLHANHFTVSVNALSAAFPGVAAVLDFVEARGWRINDVGGRVKGTVDLRLEQGATMADRQPVAFADGVHTVPTAFYEFALRHPDREGKLFPGFIEGNAEKIFDSTSARLGAR